MPRYRVSPRGGTNPIDVVDSEGKIIKVSVLQFKTKRIAETVAEELNRAFDHGVRAGSSGVADMLLSRFDQDGCGEWQDGWRGAAKEAREFRMEGLTDQ